MAHDAGDVDGFAESNPGVGEYDLITTGHDGHHWHVFPLPGCMAPASARLEGIRRYTELSFELLKSD